VNLRFFMKKVITVVVDTENEARFTRLGGGRAESRKYSLRVAEVADPGSPQEHQWATTADFFGLCIPTGGFSSRTEEPMCKCETISLPRSIPFALRGLIGPFVTGIPRESRAFTLETTRKAFAAKRRTGRDQR
jgi:hypothetical protein